MDMDTNFNPVDKKQLQVEETDDSCRVDCSELVPPARDTDGSCTRECVSGDLVGEVREVDLTDLKQEPDDVCLCCVLFPILSYYSRGFVQILGNTSSFLVSFYQDSGQYL